MIVIVLQSPRSYRIQRTIVLEQHRKQKQRKKPFERLKQIIKRNTRVCKYIRF